MISPRTGLQWQAADLLEVGELGHFHAVEPHLPAQAPGAQGGRLPVVFDEADVVHFRVDAERRERLEVELLDVRGRGLEHHLVLVVVLQPVRVLAVAAVLWPARGLHVGRLPGLGPERAQEGRGVEGSGADLHVVGLQQRAALAIPELVQAEDELLESEHGEGADFTGFASRARREAKPRAARAPRRARANRPCASRASRRRSPAPLFPAGRPRTRAGARSHARRARPRR